MGVKRTAGLAARCLVVAAALSPIVLIASVDQASTPSGSPPSAAEAAAEAETQEQIQAAVSTVVIAETSEDDGLICRGDTFISVQACIDAHDDGELLTVRIEDDIRLGIGQTIDLSGRANIVLDGWNAETGTRHTLAETDERTAGAARQSREYLRIGDAASRVTVRNLAFADSDGDRFDLGELCQVEEGEIGSAWADGPCDPLIRVGTGDGVTTDVDLFGLAIDSAKAMLVQVLAVEGLDVSHSTFRNGSVLGIHFDIRQPKVDVDLDWNTFERIGTNAILATHVSGLNITNSRFVDNHHDPQWVVCGREQDVACSGGQLLVTGNAPVADVHITGNRIWTTHADGSPSLRATTGVEIHPKQPHLMTGVVIMNNQIFNNGRRGIQLHGVEDNVGTAGVGSYFDAVVRNNSLVDNGRYFGWQRGDVEEFVSMHGTAHVDSSANRVRVGTGPWTTGSFLTTPTTCAVGTAGTCGIEVAWRITNIPAGKTPIVRVNGEPYAVGVFTPGRRRVWESSKFTAPDGDPSRGWIRVADYRFELFLDVDDTEPLAVLNVHGTAPRASS